ncbi:MAG: hypothetical protein IKA56_06350 [Clostridia bacterium]|nr:hypothetical protein [Clostridia bacterium]
MAFCKFCGTQIKDGSTCTCPEAVAESQKNQAPVTEQAFNPYGAGEPVNNVEQTASTGAQTTAQQNPGQPSKIDLNKLGKDFGVSVDTEKVKSNIEGAINKINGGDVAQENNSIYERGMRIVPDSIKANDGEVPIRQYNFAKLRTRYLFAKAEGRLQITNKRILFRATGRSIMGKSTLHQEFELSQIGGVEFRNRYDFNILSFIGGLLVTFIFFAIGSSTAGIMISNFGNLYVVQYLALGFQLFTIAASAFAAYYLKKIKSFNKYLTVRQMLMSPGIGALVTYTQSGWFSEGFDPEFLIIAAVLLGIPVLINLFLISFVPDLVAIFKTKGAIPGFEIKKENPQALLAFLFTGRHEDSNSGFMEVLPWTDTDRAIKEVATIIDDIQTMGDAAIEKWQEK